MDEEMIKFSDKVKEGIQVKSVKIKFPSKLFDRFDSFAKIEADDCYWLAIDKLLNAYENKEEVNVRLEGIEKRILMIEESVSQPQIETKTESKKKHFGKGDEK